MHPLPIEYAETQNIYGETVGRGVKHVLFTAAEHGEGVSTVAYAIAQKAASDGRKVLFVDFNTHRSFTRDVLCLPATEWDLEQGPRPADFFHIKGTGLSFLPAPAGLSFGMRCRNPETIATALKRMEADFDLVIGDAPCLCKPNLHGIPATILASCFDSTLLVVASGRTSRGLVDRAVQQLMDANAHFAGVVMNDATFPSLYKELIRQFHKSGFIGRWLERRLGPSLRQAPFLTDLI